jgi:hypothetical protein
MQKKLQTFLSERAIDFGNSGKCAGNALSLQKQD